MKGEAPPELGRSASLLPSSSSERRPWTPTVSCGREAGRLSKPGIFTGAPSASHEAWGQSQCSEDRTEDAGIPFKASISGEVFPLPISCHELVGATLSSIGAGTDLSRFIRLSLSPLRDASLPAFSRRSDLWPCPPPRWGRWTGTSSTLSPKRRRRLRHLKVRALCTQHLILALNWLALGQCSTPPDYARAGYPYTPGQLELMERLEDLVDYYLGVGEITLDSLGRAGEKLKKLSAVAFSLPGVSEKFDFDDISSFLSNIQKSFDSYSRTRNRHERSSSSQQASGPTGRDLGAPCPRDPTLKVPSNACSAKPVVASRIKWKLKPSFDPRPYLNDPVVRQAFEDPDFLRKPPTDWHRLPKAKVHASRAEVLALAEKWDQLGACRLVQCSSVPDIEAVGMFAVPKDEQYDRLILNPTVVNSRSFAYSNFTRTIAPGYLISMISLAPREQLMISSDDLCEFYYTFVVSEKRAKRNAVGIRFDASEVSHFSVSIAESIEVLFLCVWVQWPWAMH